MKSTDYKMILEEIIHSTLYEGYQKEDFIDKVNEIANYLKDSNSFIDDLRTIVSSKNSENYYVYSSYIIHFLSVAPLNVKLELLNNHSLYEDFMFDDSIYQGLWYGMHVEEKINYLNSKKKFNDLDYMLINYSLADNGKFKVNKILDEIINNDKLQNKIEDHRIKLSYSYSLLSCVNITDYKLCKLFTKESYTKLLLKKYRKFSDFKNLVDSDKKIYRLVASNSLIFDNQDNEEIYKYLLKNHNYIGKFDYKYADLFSIMEIAKISEDNTLGDHAFSTVLQKLYQFNKEKANSLFSIDNLKRCAKHSIVVNPFNYLSEETKKTILNDYSIFNRFVDTIMIEIINDNYSEDDILNSLRDDDFVNDMSSYAIELLLNRISFKSAFNMMQRQIIFKKINNLNVKVTDKDKLFFKGFLDSPILLYKSEHSMIYEMLSMLSKEDILYYITLPYVNDRISNCEIVNLINDNELSILDIADSNYLINKLNTTDIINIIDHTFEKNPDLILFKDKKLCKLIFGLNEETWNRINIDEVNYLYENIRMKSLLSKRESKPTILSYKAVMASYLVFGLEGTLEIVNNGNNDVTLDDVKKLQSEVVNERLLLFRENNSSIFQNINKKITSSLEKIGYIDSFSDLSIQAKKNTFLDNIIYLMLESEFDSYNNILDKLYTYTRTYKTNEYAAKQAIYDYSKDFVSHYLNTKLEEYNKDFENVILRNFTPKDHILYNKRKEIGRAFLDKLKFKLFVNTLTDNDKDEFRIYYKDDYNIDNILEDYKKYLAKSEVEFDSLLAHVLIPIIHERFDKENCLNKLGISKPEDTDRYLEYLDDVKDVELINKEINKFKNKLTDEQVKELMENICYSSDVSFNLTHNKKQKLNYLNGLIKKLHGEVDIDYSNLALIYKDDMDLYNINDILEYVKYLDILDSIIKRTKKFINKCMDDEKVKNYHSHAYYKAVDNYNFVFPLTNVYYESKKHVLSLEDIEKIFNGFELNKHDFNINTLYDFLINKKNLIMVIDGYYEGIVDTLGIIITKWNRLCEEVKKNRTLITLYNTLASLDKGHYTVIKSLDHLIIEDIYKDSYYEEKDVNKRIEMLTDLFINGHKRCTSSIPYLCYRNEQYRIETLDNYNEDTYRVIGDSLYRIGAVGNDLLHYSILNKNGVQIGIYENDVLTNKVIGVRNGNTLYLNGLEGKVNIDHHELLHLFAKQLINITKDSNERIDFVTIVNNDNYTSRSGTIIDTTICSNINSPINVDSVDFIEFSQYKNLLNLNELHTNYNDNVSTLLASDMVIDKNSFKYYNPSDFYLRIRNSVTKLSNNIGETYMAKINSLLYLCKLENPSLDINVNISDMDTIYLGDDFVLFLDDEENILEYVLPYDSRAKDEIDSIKKRLEKN